MSGTGSDRERPWNEIIAPAGWEKIEAATGLRFSSNARDCVCLSIYLASRARLATLQGAPLSEAQAKKVKAVLKAAARLAADLQEVDAAGLEERLLTSCEVVQTENRAERELDLLQPHQVRPTILSQIGDAPFLITPGLLRSFPSELVAAAQYLLALKGGKRNRDADRKALRQRLKAILTALEQEQAGRAPFKRFIAALIDALPIGDPSRHLLGTPESASASLRPSRRNGGGGKTARKPSGTRQ